MECIIGPLSSKGIIRPLPSKGIIVPSRKISICLNQRCYCLPPASSSVPILKAMPSSSLEATPIIPKTKNDDTTFWAEHGTILIEAVSMLKAILEGIKWLFKSKKTLTNLGKSLSQIFGLLTAKLKSELLVTAAGYAAVSTLTGFMFLPVGAYPYFSVWGIATASALLAVHFGPRWLLVACCASFLLCLARSLFPDLFQKSEDKLSADEGGPLPEDEETEGPLTG